PGRTAVGRICLGVHARFRGPVSTRCGHAEPSDVDLGAGGARQRSALLVDQTLDAVFAHRPRLVSLDCTDWSVDRGARRVWESYSLIAVAGRAALDSGF